MGKSILITDEDIDLKNCCIGTPWSGDTATFNVRMPKETMNVNVMQDWVNQLGDLQEVTTIFIGCALKKDEYRFLNDLTNIEQIHISDATELDSIDFIKGFVDAEVFRKEIFEWVKPYHELKYQNHVFILCHYPFLEWNGFFRGSIHLHGHQHNDIDYNLDNLEKGIRRYDVGVDANNMTPVSADEIIDFFSELP